MHAQLLKDDEVMGHPPSGLWYSDTAIGLLSSLPCWRLREGDMDFFVQPKDMLENDESHLVGQLGEKATFLLSMRRPLSILG